MSALKQQPGGTHYKQMKIQPVQYIHANGLGYCEANIVKYVSRWRDKNGLEDLLKARHYIDLLIELEGLDRPIPPVGTPVEWPEDESRIDIIATNGNDGLHYAADGWIEWKGGAAPVGEEVEVDVRMRDGDEVCGYPADSWVWRHDPVHVDGDIIAWRLSTGGRHE